MVELIAPKLSHIQSYQLNHHICIGTQPRKDTGKSYFLCAPLLPLLLPWLDFLLQRRHSGHLFYFYLDSQTRGHIKTLKQYFKSCFAKVTESKIWQGHDPVSTTFTLLEFLLTFLTIIIHLAYMLTLDKVAGDMHQFQPHSFLIHYFFFPHQSMNNSE